ncbi:MAG: gamma-glutamyltransferase [Desulfovibrionaceae bacterium]|nr:gamma-glutamyltransferase [Desulfovibrionaceae bacterium]
MIFAQRPYNATESQRFNPVTPHAMVTSPHYLATQAGVHVLRKGGTALDAAIAVAAVLAVVYPQMGTIGGDNLWLIYDAHAKTMRGLNASGRSGERVSLSFFASQGLQAIPMRGALAACTVPGVVSGWEKAQQLSRQWGSPLSLADLLEDAIMLARDGFAVAPSLAYWLHEDCKLDSTGYRQLQRFSDFARCYLPNGKPAALGQRLCLPELAATLEQLAREGARCFYEGDIAQRIVAWHKANGGLLTARDFAEHSADWVEPLHISYRGLDAYNLPPSTQGMASLSILNILENYDLSAFKEGSAAYYHLLIEATKLAFAERDTYLTDPDFASIPVQELLSAQHGRELAACIRFDKALPPHAPLEPKGDTCWFGVVDAQGNAVSMIQSIFHDFGAGVVAGDTGVLLQNRGCFFSLDSKHVNRLEPRKRTMHTLNPPMLLKENRPYLVYGTMGGEGQPQTQAALVTRMVDFHFSPQDAVAAPRWLYGRTWGMPANNVKLEKRIPQAVADALQKLGHDVAMTPEYCDVMGHAGAILCNSSTGMLHGATDPRSDGLAAGY